MNKYIIQHFTIKDHDEIHIYNANACFPEGSPDGVTFATGYEYSLYLRMEKLAEQNDKKVEFNYIFKDHDARYMITEADGVNGAYMNYLLECYHRSIKRMNDEQYMLIKKVFNMDC